jgi:hypothetical protein
MPTFHRPVWHGVNGLAAIPTLIGPQLEDQRLAGAGRRLDNDIAPLAQGGHSLLLPQIGNRDTMEQGQIFQLFSHGCHTTTINENGRQPSCSPIGPKRLLDLKSGAEFGGVLPIVLAG